MTNPGALWQIPAPLQANALEGAAGTDAAKLPPMDIDLSRADSQPISSRSLGRVRARAISGRFLERLKAETAAEHAAIEAASRVMDPALSIEAYRAYLERTFGFYRVVEEQLRALHVWEALGLAGSEREKLPLLAEDIVLLAEVEPASIRVCDQPPRFASTLEAVGGAYVLEGSTLGGRVISRHIQGLFGPDVPRVFLECYGATTREKWQSFRAALARYATTREMEDRIIAGAQETFRSLTRWLER